MAKVGAQMLIQTVPAAHSHIIQTSSAAKLQTIWISSAAGAALTQDNVSASIINKQHGLVVRLLFPALQNLIQIVNGPGPLHQVDPGLLKTALQKFAAQVGLHNSETMYNTLNFSALALHICLTVSCIYT